MRRTARFLVVAVLAALFTAVPGPRTAAAAVLAPVVAEASIGASSDDVEQFPNGYPMRTSTDLELVDADEGAGQTVGLRFAGIGLPRGVTVTDAWVQFTVDEAQDDPTSLTIAGQAADSAATFSTTTNDVTSRPHTTATVAWQPDPWSGVGTATPASRTPDLTPLVQELVDRTGWSSSSALALVISGTGHRTAIAYDHTPALAPRLHVTYTPAPDPDPTLLTVDTRVARSADDGEELSTGPVTRSSADLEMVEDGTVVHTVGLRFGDLGIPPGSQIVRSWIQFTADEANSGAAALTITGNDMDNAPVLGPNNRNLTSRPRTTETVAWSPADWTVVGEAGEAQRTPDLSPVLQEVVDRPYWWNGSAVGFTIGGTGHRTAVAYDLNPAQAPALHVEYRLGTPAPYNPSTYRLAAIGDFGNGSPSAGDVANVISGLNPDAVVTTGDNSYTAAAIDENIGRFYQGFIGNYRGAYGTGSPVNRFFPSLGNHDYTDGAGLPGYLDYFDIPGPGASGSGRTSHERYYDVVLGPIHVFAVNSNLQEPDGNTADSVQAQWLREGLAASTSPWQVITLHHSPFSSGEHGSDPAMQWPFAEWGADAVLSGHDHDYERLEADGIPYIVTGLGGVSRYTATTIDPHSELFYGADDGALLVEACAGRLDFSLHTVANGVVDELTVGGPDCSVPEVTVEASDALSAEPGADTGQYTIRRAGPTSRPLTVRYTMSGTASAGADYALLSGSVTIPPGADRAWVSLNAADDAAVEADETAVLTLTDRGDYDVGAAGSATITVRSDDPAWVTRDLYPVEQQRVFGTVTGGGLLSLRTSDNVRLSMREELGPSNPPNSLVEFRFRLPTIPVHQQLTLVVEGHHSPNTEGDDLLVDWSRNGGPWHPLVTVTKTADNGTAQFKLLPSWINEGDVVSLRVRDANRTPGRRQLDTAFVDRLFLRAIVPG